MSGIKDILEQMDPLVRRRIEEDIDRYAPFLGLLAAWKAAIAEHIERVEQRTLTRLMEQFLPLGEWRFPAQTIITPQTPHEREITMEVSFQDPLRGVSWIPCGHGWTLPSQLVDWRIERAPDGRLALVLFIEYEHQMPESLLTERGQLAFVAGDEILVSSLAQSSWAIRYPGQPFKPISVERYTGYLEFEREMSVARLSHRHLEFWLPPFHPYSRKFLRFYHSESSEATAIEWEWLSTTQATTQLVALIDEDTATYIEDTGNLPPIVLNAIPVIQAQVLYQPIVTPLPAVGDTYKVSFAGISNFFAAIAQAGDVLHRANIVRTPAEMPIYASRTDQVLYDVHVTCDQSAAGVKVYYNCLGEEVSQDQSSLGFLRGQRGHGIRGENFSTFLPAVGGMNLLLSKPDDEGARLYWYHSLLRPNLLTEADIKELLSHLPICQSWFHIDQTMIQLDVTVNHKQVRTKWDTYLYPSLINDSSTLEMRTDYFALSRAAIVPIMRLWLHPRRPDVPHFLLREAARYAASVISRYFMIGWYQIQGSVVED